MIFYYFLKPSSNKDRDGNKPTNDDLMRAFLPSTLPQPELSSAIQLLGSSNVDLHGMGDSDIVTTPPDLSPRAPDTQGEAREMDG